MRTRAECPRIVCNPRTGDRGTRGPVSPTCRSATLDNRPARGCRTNSSNSYVNPRPLTRLPCAARNEPRSTETTSGYFYDPSVETDSCDSLAPGDRRHFQGKQGSSSSRVSLGSAFPRWSTTLSLRKTEVVGSIDSGEVAILNDQDLVRVWSLRDPRDSIRSHAPQPRRNIRVGQTGRVRSNRRDGGRHG